MTVTRHPPERWDYDGFRTTTYGNITVKRLFPSGSLYLSAIRRRRYCEYKYMGYTVREALAMFREEFPCR